MALQQHILRILHGSLGWHMTKYYSGVLIYCSLFSVKIGFVHPLKNHDVKCKVRYPSVVTRGTQDNKLATLSHNNV